MQLKIVTHGGTFRYNQSGQPLAEITEPFVLVEVYTKEDVVALYDQGREHLANAFTYQDDQITGISVYTGNAVNALVTRANSSVYADGNSYASFTADAGVTYHIQVRGNSGAFRLDLNQKDSSVPAATGNDSRADAYPMTGSAPDGTRCGTSLRRPSPGPRSSPCLQRTGTLWRCILLRTTSTRLLTVQQPQPTACNSRPRLGRPITSRPVSSTGNRFR